MPQMVILVTFTIAWVAASIFGMSSSSSDFCPRPFLYESFHPISPWFAADAAFEFAAILHQRKFGNFARGQCVSPRAR
ncbi:hypothetical protein [Brucella anthropi]|uniref:hypothetical protein n=1 Tax=Brucella anthropi TaxID=529 RepID=UPI00141E1E55|nr:hypothetical protein [Brucella anthropi]